MAFFLPASWFKISSVQLTINQTKLKKNYCMQHVYRGIYVLFGIFLFSPYYFFGFFLVWSMALTVWIKTDFSGFQVASYAFESRKIKIKFILDCSLFLSMSLCCLYFFFYFVSLLNIIKNSNVHYLQRLSWYLFLIMCKFVFVAHLRLEHTRDFTHK